MASIIAMSVTKVFTNIFLVALCWCLVSGAVSRLRRMKCPTAELLGLDESICTYGVHRDICGRFFCAKGPDELCRTSSWLIRPDDCGSGTFCNSCGRCGGCSLITGECALQSCAMANTYSFR